MPFDVLSGFREALAAKEQEMELCSPIELSQSQKELINNKLLKVRKGDELTVRYYHEGSYCVLNGYLERIDEIYHYLIISGTFIRFEDINMLIIEEK